MKLKAFAVIDTNVLISSRLSEKGCPHKIFNLVESGNIIPIFDERMLKEYNRVLHYDKFSFNENDIYDSLYPIVNNGILINDVERAREYFKDNDDVPFYEVTISSQELDSRLITGNTKHFPNADYVVVPQVMINTMTYMDKFLTRDWQYDKVMKDLIQMQTSTSKYTSGKDLIDDMFDTENKVINPSSKLLQLQATEFDSSLPKFSDTDLSDYDDIFNK